MDEFGYLSVLLSIVIGLAMTEILQGLRQRMLAVDRVKPYLPTKLWAGTLLLVSAQMWWAMFDYRNRHDWVFEQFFVLLIQAILLYLAAGLVFPEFHGSGTIDFREHYYRQRTRFFSLLLAGTLASLYRDWAFNRSLPDRANLIFHLLYIAVAVTAIATAREWYHKFLALFMTAVFVFYITTLFTRLH